MNKKIIENKKILIIGIAIIILILLFMIKIIDNKYQKNNSTNTEYISSIETEKEEAFQEEKIIIYITGEVNKEGVIELPEGSRIADAIEKAEGVTENANLKNVNLAYALEDGQKIYIPNKNEEETIITEFTEGIVNDSDDVKQNKSININKADINELQTLNGIGESLAQSIIKYREENGNFKTIEDVKNVPGIGENKFENIKENIKIKW